jgi:hypothetical protein
MEDDVIMERAGFIEWADKEPSLAAQIDAIAAVALMPEGRVKADLAEALVILIKRAVPVSYVKAA